MGFDDPKEIEEALNNALEKLAEQGMSPEGKQATKNLLFEYKVIFRVKLGNGPPANVDPLMSY